MGKKLRTYYAKSANSFHGAITNREHLDKVATLARRFGAEIGKEKAAGVAGGVHDFGKYADRFQGVLSGTHQGVDHALPSAAELYRLLDLRTTQRVWADGICAVEAVAGHHDGLIGMPQMQDGLEEMLSSDDWDDCPSGKMPSLHGQEEFMQAEEAFAQDFPDFHMQRIQGKRSRVQGRLEDMLDTRMLFSCLVDADYCVSASDDDPAYLEKNSRPPLDAEAMLKKLEVHCAHLRKTSTADVSVNALRNEVYARCGEAGEQPMGLFTLTAPTGVGKTMAMIHFALRHCVQHQLPRIIVVLPFLTLAEQLQKEYEHIFPEILVDHSQENLPEAARELAARWDSPVIITTSVRFFESLFSANPQSCRKLHHIANSVVLFDEVEKAHPDVFNILLQILEDGRLTDNTGRTVSFKNTIIVMTSNAGAHDIGEGRAMGFGSKALADATNYNAMKDAVMKAVKDVFRPEFINRVDELIVFHPLTEVEIRAIAGMMLGQVASRLKERAIALTWDDEVVEKLAREGYDVKFGARPLRRLIQRTVEDTLSEELLGGKIALGDRVRLKVTDGKITVEKEA